MKRYIHFLYGAAEADVDLLQTIERFAAIGCDGVELSPEPFLNAPEMAKQVVDAAASFGMDIVFGAGFPPDCDMASGDAQVRENGCLHMEKILSVMEKAGVRLLGGTMCTTWPSYRTKTLPVGEKRRIVEQTAQCVQKAIASIENRGIIIAMEPVNRFEGFLFNTAEEGVDFCKRVDNPNFGIMLDCFHMSVEENSISDAVHKAGPYLKYLHLAENNRRLPGMGEFAWDAFFESLRKIGYAGPFGMEAFLVPGGEVSASVGLWRDLSSGADDSQLDRMLRNALNFMQKKALDYGFA